MSDELKLAAMVLAKKHRNGNLLYNISNSVRKVVDCSNLCVFPDKFTP